MQPAVVGCRVRATTVTQRLVQSSLDALSNKFRTIATMWGRDNSNKVLERGPSDRVLTSLIEPIQPDVLNTRSVTMRSVAHDKRRKANVLLTAHRHGKGSTPNCSSVPGTIVGGGVAGDTNQVIVVLSESILCSHTMSRNPPSLLVDVHLENPLCAGRPAPGCVCAGGDKCHNRRYGPSDCLST